jgi:hypothetical protein
MGVSAALPRSYSTGAINQLQPALFIGDEPDGIKLLRSGLKEPQGITPGHGKEELEIFSAVEGALQRCCRILPGDELLVNKSANGAPVEYMPEVLEEAVRYIDHGMNLKVLDEIARLT